MAAKKSKPSMSMALIGPQSCGKTIALGHLSHLLGGFQDAEQQHAETKALAKEMGHPSCEHAWMLDRCLQERERDITVESSLQSFESENYRYTAADTPGHEGFSKNLLGVTSLTDIAVLCVSAKEEEFDEVRTRELALACFTMGVKNIAVMVTKMDDPTVLFSANKFEDIKKVVSAFVKEVGYKQKEVPFIPVSGLHGDNLITKSSEMSWYTGQPLIDTLDSMGPISRPAEKPLRLPVLKVHELQSGDGTVIVGRVETGQVRPGLKVIFSSSGLIADVREVQHDGAKVNEASGGDIVGLCLAVPSDLGQTIRKGMVASYSTADPAADAETFLARVIVLDHPGTIRPGYCPTICVHTAQVPCEFEKLLSKIDRKTGKESDLNPEQAKTGEVVMVRMRPRAPVCVEPFSAYPPLGRFSIRDHNRTIAVGVVQEVTKRPIPKFRMENENQYFEGND